MTSLWFMDSHVTQTTWAAGFCCRWQNYTIRRLEWGNCIHPGKWHVRCEQCSRVETPDLGQPFSWRWRSSWWLWKIPLDSHTGLLLTRLSYGRGAHLDLPCPLPTTTLHGVLTSFPHVSRMTLLEEKACSLVLLKTHQLIKACSILWCKF